MNSKRKTLIIKNFSSKKGYKKHRRDLLKRTHHRIYMQHFLNVAHNCKVKNISFYPPPKYVELKRVIFSTTRPKFPPTIQYLSNVQKAFSKEVVKLPEDNTFHVPEIFSLTEADEESFFFLKKLFYALYHDKCEKIIIDYSHCKRIDLDASICMDILLKEFISYMRACRAKGFPLVTRSILPININNQQVIKTLFSIGSFSLHRGLSINFKDILPYPLCIGSKKRRNAGAKREIDITNLMEYVLNCLKRSKKELTSGAEDNLYKVIGEILINAEEHSDMDKRYSIGYFQQTPTDVGCIEEGVFNLVIFNFGKTIYEKFKDPNCPNNAVVKQMQELSKSYTNKNFFLPAEFEEETLWTLYALQEGVTSHKDWKRGNGSIRFIDSFFKLKGDDQIDNVSRMTIMSGNARIVFDGEYQVIEKSKPGQRKPNKLMTFNNSGGFDEQPDKKFVNFANNYFPGTMIVAKINIKSNILENNGGGNESSIH